MQQWRSEFVRGPLKGAEKSSRCAPRRVAVVLSGIKYRGPPFQLPFFLPFSSLPPPSSCRNILSFLQSLSLVSQSLVIGASRFFFFFFPSFSEFSLSNLPYNSRLGLSVSIHSLTTHPSIDTFCPRRSTKTYHICAVSSISNWHHHEGIRFSLGHCRPQRRHGHSHAIQEQPSVQASLAARRFGFWKW